MGKILTLLLLVSLLACSYEESGPCNVDNPVEDLPWLKEMIQEIEGSWTGRHYTYIHKTYYQGQPLFIIGSCCPNCSFVLPVYNCNGDLICTAGECPDGFRNKTLIWTSSKNGCLF